MNTYYILSLANIILLLALYFISKKVRIVRKIFIPYVFLINTIYIVVRFVSIPVLCGIPSLIVGLLLFVTELVGLFSFCIYVFIFTGKKRNSTKSLYKLSSNLPSVDVLICTYNEEIKLLSKTIQAAKMLDYPKEKYNIYVLDDGHRNELKDYCKSCNVNYITRIDNNNAKAGSINNALTHITSELFTVLDADMICKPDYLIRTVRIF